MYDNRAYSNKVARRRAHPRRLLSKLFGIGTWLEAILVLVVVRIGLAHVRYQRLLQLLEQSAKRARMTKTVRADTKARVVRAMHRARRVGVANASCLEEALSIQWMLRRRNIESQVQIGVKRTQEDGLLGHAWVECAGEIVSTDVNSPAAYIVLTSAADGLPHESYRRNRSL